MHSARIVLLFALLSSLAMFTGCDKSSSDSGSSAEKEEPKSENPVWGDLDLSKRLEALQGTWTLKLPAMGLVDYEGSRKMMEEMTLQVEGDQATFTAAQGEVVKGTLVVTSPCAVEFTKASDEGRRGFDFVASGSELYLGLGGAGVKLGDGFITCEDRGYVVYDGEACKYYAEMFGPKEGFEAPVDVHCAFEGDTFNYQVPDFMDDTKRKDKSLMRSGDLLLSEQMREDHKLTKK